MPSNAAYYDDNRRQWDERAPVHAASPGYGLDRFRSDPAALSTVVAFDAPLLGDLTGTSAVHLQCHIGTDTISLARLGATVTGLDFSSASLAQARDLAAELGIEARFVESNLYDAPKALGGEQFDLVYTGIGALCWLPDITAWAQVVRACLRPGGRLFIREGHPMLWALDFEREDELLCLSYPYFEREEPNHFDYDETYVEVPEGTSFTATVSHDWNHGVGEILTAVLEAGLTIEGFHEHRVVDWQPFDLFQPIEGTGLYELPEAMQDLMPLTYTLIARRPLDQAGSPPAGAARV